MLKLINLEENNHTYPEIVKSMKKVFYRIVQILPKWKIERIKNHIFNNEHDLGEVMGCFDADYDMSLELNVPF